ncbi:MAG TPA: diguanylate phosphodiesterase [Firmicutes bacterium]|jgi:EAL and modified HD-GYP domain-containing signal transduction protein|nr:diguanylate phosphodiesterase [Bacillota bacterium]
MEYARRIIAKFDEFNRRWVEGWVFMDVYVARQPIYDTNLNVAAHELLFRSSLDDACSCGDLDYASLALLVNSFIAIGMDRLSGGKPVHVNFTQKLLEDGVASLFPPETVVVEVLETTTPSPETLNALAHLKEQGFRIALDDYTGQPHLEPFLKLADIIKVDFTLASKSQRALIPRTTAARPGTVFLAEKVSTRDEFQLAVRHGYRLFQGNFLSRPEVAKAADIPPDALASFQLLRKVHEPAPDFDALASIISRDVSLSYRLLRVVNSAAFGLRSRVTSIKHALVLMGIAEVRRWISVLTVTGLPGDKPRALADAAIVRARMAELLAVPAGLSGRASELFLTGLLSLMDALLDRPMSQVVDLLPLTEDTRAALLGEPNPFLPVLQVVTAYEGAQWDQVETVAPALRIHQAFLAEAYANSLAWVDDLSKL